MLNSNDHINEGRGNGTLARFRKVVLKKDSTLTCKIWDGYHVNTVSVDDVKFIVCEHWEDSGGTNNNHQSPRTFKLYPEITKVNIKMKLFGSKKKHHLQISIEGNLDYWVILLQQDTSFKECPWIISLSSVGFIR